MNIALRHLPLVASSIMLIDERTADVPARLILLRRNDVNWNENPGTLLHGPGSG